MSKNDDETVVVAVILYACPGAVCGSGEEGVDLKKIDGNGKTMYRHQLSPSGWNAFHIVTTGKLELAAARRCNAKFTDAFHCYRMLAIAHSVDEMHAIPVGPGLIDAKVVPQTFDEMRLPCFSRN